MLHNHHDGRPSYIYIDKRGTDHSSSLVIGQAVVKDLLSHGHQVLGLARNDTNAEKLLKAGAEVYRGDIKNVESLKVGVKATDGVIHLAWIRDFDDFSGVAAINRRAIAAMGDAMVGTGKPLIIASGTLGVATGQIASEDMDPDRNFPMAARYESADVLYALSKYQGVRGSVIRLPPIVHGLDDWAFVPMFSEAARKTGSVVYIDEQSRWCTVHKDDAAVLFRLALEKGTAAATYHAVAEEGVKIKDIMAAIGRKMDLPVAKKPVEEAAKSVSFLANLIALDTPASSEKSRKELDWKPTQIGLLADIEANYFGSNYGTALRD